MSGIVGRGSGNPNGIPDFRPLNPWGRPMPKPSRPYRDAPLRHALYQVEIDLRDGGVLKASPMMAEEMAGAAAEGLNRLPRVGDFKDWGPARVVLVKPAEKRDTRTIGELLLGNR